uniref:Receptor ligand binding region domain-containing protein n=1 Tax=Salvator merianae TaxID=96440 RepID=A0A8D0AV37_SALMN
MTSYLFSCARISSSPCLFPMLCVFYGAFDAALSDKTHFPSFYRMVPKEEAQYVGIVQLLKHFGWNWIGFIVSDDERGESFLRTLKPKLQENNICIAWTEVVPFVTWFTPEDIFMKKLTPVQAVLSRRKINVTLVYGDNQSLEGLQFILLILEGEYHSPVEGIWISTAEWEVTTENNQSLDCLQFVLLTLEIDYHSPVEGIWISTAEWEVTTESIFRGFPLKSFNGTLSFTPHANEVPKFKDFLENINPLKGHVSYLPDFWRNAFRCSLPMFNLYSKSGRNCTGKEKLSDLSATSFEMQMSGLSYNVYNAVHAVTCALQAMERFQNKLKLRKRKPTCSYILVLNGHLLFPCFHLYLLFLCSLSADLKH